MYLRNAIALITGGAQGLGKGFAKSILEAGGKVSLLDIKEDVGVKTAQEFNSQFGKNSALFIKCDVRKQQEVQDAFKKTHDIFGKLDLVVNNAGVATLSPDQWERTIDINLTAVARCCLIAAQYLAINKNGTGGHIVNIASAAGLTSVPVDFAYVASKHGVVGLSRSLAETWEGLSIRVSCLCPTFADTEIVKQSIEANPAFKLPVAALGIMSIDKVVDSFKMLLEEKNTTGGVLFVSPYEVKYRHKPRPIHTAAKL